MSKTNHPVSTDPAPAAITRPWLRRHWLLSLVLLALLAGGGIAAYLKLQKANDVTANLRFAKVELGDLEKTVTAVGSLKAKEYVDVGTQVSGRVVKIRVQIGAHVNKGDLIAEIDPTVYAATVNKDRANLDNLRAQLGQREAEQVLANEQFARNGRLAAANAVSTDLLQQSQSTARVAAAAVRSVQAQIKAADATLGGDLANLGYTKIYSPMSGTVVVQDTREGQTVNSVQSVAVIAQVANLEVMTVWAQVAEADVNQLKPGLPAWFTTLGMPEHKWRGSIQQVQPTPVTTNDVVLYYALVDVDNRQGQLLPAMTVQAFFVLGEAKNVLIVPMSALKPLERSGGQAGKGSGERRRTRKSAESGSAEAASRNYRVQVKTASGALEWRKVSIGLSTRTAAEVRAGLALGEEVVVGEKITSPVGNNAAQGAGGGRNSGGRVPGGMGPRL